MSRSLKNKSGCATNSSLCRMVHLTEAQEEWNDIEYQEHQHFSFIHKETKTYLHCFYRNTMNHNSRNTAHLQHFLGFFNYQIIFKIVGIKLLYLRGVRLLNLLNCFHNNVKITACFLVAMIVIKKKKKKSQLQLCNFDNQVHNQ